MKKLLFLSLIAIGFASCGDDECVKCSQNLLGLEVETEACDNGDGTLTITATVDGETATETATGTLDEFRTESEAAGANCD